MQLNMQGSWDTECAPTTHLLLVFLCLCPPVIVFCAVCACCCAPSLPKLSLHQIGTLGSLVLKLGPKYDMGALCPDKNEGWQKAAVGKNWCVWIKKNEDSQQ